MKKLLLLFLASLPFASLFAQGNDIMIETDDQHAFFIGLKGGIDFTTMSQPKECDLYDGVGLGFSGGVVAKARFSRSTETAPAGTGALGVGLELKYKINTVKTIGTDDKDKENANLSVSYFEVPVYLQFYPFYKSDAMKNFYFEVGPDFAGTMSRSPKTLTVKDLSGEFNYVKYHLDDEESTLKGLDVRLMAGLGYEFPVGKNLVGLNARYYMGTSKLAGNFDSKMNTFELSFSWLFNIGTL